MARGQADSANKRMWLRAEGPYGQPRVNYRCDWLLGGEPASDALELAGHAGASRWCSLWPAASVSVGAWLILVAQVLLARVVQASRPSSALCGTSSAVACRSPALLRGELGCCSNVACCVCGVAWREGVPSGPAAHLGAVCVSGESSVFGRCAVLCLLQ